jgi:release factor glutamine methyltransferase
VTDPSERLPYSTGYVPELAPDEIERIRRWHEGAYQQGREDGQKTQTFDYLGLSIVVPPGVMPITGVSHMLGQAVLDEVTPADKVLDMGTGSGVNAVLAASKGARVVAVDVNPRAIEAARHNAERNQVASLVELRLSDVFSNVDETFDLIVFDPPFRWFAPRDMFEGVMTDENYGAMTRFFSEARRHLAPGGQMLIFFGTSGDLGYLRSLISRAGFAERVLSSHELAREDQKVEYFTFLVS